MVEVEVGVLSHVRAGCVARDVGPIVALNEPESEKNSDNPRHLENGTLGAAVGVGLWVAQGSPRGHAAVARR